MAEKPKATAFDALAAGLAPALIIGMIGSLVFFLVIAFYQGQYDARLMYILGLYTVATVLIARIAIESGRAHAAMFAAPLAIAAVLAMFRFVTIEGHLAGVSWLINVGLLLLSWYLADRITYDCTLLEEDRESLQGGLLQTLGAAVNGTSSSEAVPPKAGKARSDLKKAKHNPGVWVLYFALIAFPLFGLGQLVIPDQQQRWNAFALLVVYLGCALGLLMTTSLLGLRRYLRQRGTSMPTELTMRWLVTGGAIIAAVLVICLLLPLPGKAVRIAGIPIQFKSPEGLGASKFGWGGEGEEKSDSKPQTAEVKSETKEGESEKADDESKTGDTKSENSKSENSNSKSQTSNSKSDQQKQKHQPNQQQPKQDQQNQDQQNRDQQNRDQQNRDRQNQDRQNQDQQNRDQRQQNQQQPNREQNQQTQKGPNQPQNQQPKNQEPQSPQQPARSPAPNLSQALSGIGDWFKWLLVVVLALIVIIYAITHPHEIAKLWRDLLNFVSALFGRKPRSTLSQEETVPSAAVGATRVAFSSFINPFRQNLKGWSPARVIEHTFLALEAWAAEHNAPRSPQQTADEFARSLVSRLPQFQSLPLQAASMLDRLMFAGWKPTNHDLRPLEELWQALERAS